MMLAYHNDKAIKAKYLRRVRAHAKADEIIRGTYWEDGRGCAVGCTIHGSDHAAYEKELGIPQMLARLEDIFFEGMPNAKAKLWPAEFLKAAKPGADLSRVGWKFLHWLLTEELAGRDHPTVRDAIKQCADVLVPLTKGLPVDRSAAWSAASAARSADSADSAASAAWSAASAESAEGAAWSAESAAWSAAESAASAERSADSAASAARSAAWGAASAARSAASAERSAASARYYRMSRKLLELMEAAT